MSAVMVATVSLVGVSTDRGALTGCTPQQAKQAGQIAVQVAVDLCQEAPQLLPPGIGAGVVSLICAAVDATAPSVQVLLSADTWNKMKADFLAAHGRLPKGMSLPTPVGSSAAPPAIKPLQ